MRMRHRKLKRRLFAVNVLIPLESLGKDRWAPPCILRGSLGFEHGLDGTTAQPTEFVVRSIGLG